MEILPQEIIGEILKFLPGRNIIRLNALNKKFYNIISSENVWKNKILFEDKIIPKEVKSWKKEYFNNSAKCDYYEFENEESFTLQIHKLKFGDIFRIGHNKPLMFSSKNNYIVIGYCFTKFRAGKKLHGKRYPINYWYPHVNFTYVDLSKYRSQCMDNIKYDTKFIAGKYSIYTYFEDDEIGERYYIIHRYSGLVYTSLEIYKKMYGIPVNHGDSDRRVISGNNM